jgi:phosphoribosylformylglycinamidine synthase
MQKRVYNVIRALSELDKNPIVSIHDHGAGGHLNSLSELIELKGGQIEIDKLPVGDPTLSYKEILSNESQERMGMVIKKKDSEYIRKIAMRERAPYYETGNVNSDKRILIIDTKNSSVPFELELTDLFGKPPVSILNGKKIKYEFDNTLFKYDDIFSYVKSLLQVESVACKDWLTNKVDRSVTGRVAMQQNTGILHLPLNNLAITALDYDGVKGIANSIGHAPLVALSDPESGSRIAVAEALTNIVWAPLRAGINGISLSANWMWPAKTEVENARLYSAVESISDFAIKLGINIPTGKDSLSMTQKYPDGRSVASPGTVIVSAVAEVTNIGKSITPVLKSTTNSEVFYIDFSGTDHSIDCSTFSMLFNKPGNNPPDIVDAGYFAKAFEAVQELIDKRLILAGHDISAGGKITSLLEMTFSADGMGMKLELPDIDKKGIMRFLFSENPGIIFQTENSADVIAVLEKRGIGFQKLGTALQSDELSINTSHGILRFTIEEYRDIWYETSFLFDLHQTTPSLARQRYDNYKKQPLKYHFPNGFSGVLTENGSKKINAAVIREKGINGDREMAYSLFHAGFNVIDVHMTDLVEGRENLENINMLVFPGGFSNSDVLGSAKGWAGAFLYNEKAKNAIENYYKRDDTMSLGVCNGCQLMTELNLLENSPKMLHNDSAKFESAFVSVDIETSPSIMLKSLEGSRLGVWIAHGEGKFSFSSKNETDYNIAMKYSYDKYPGNPNGSMFDTAGICSADGRHLAMMPHLERSAFPWQWPYYEPGHKNDEVSPWIEAFVNARKWLEAKLEN